MGSLYILPQVVLVSYIFNVIVDIVSCCVVRREIRVWSPGELIVVDRDICLTSAMGDVDWPQGALPLVEFGLTACTTRIPILVPGTADGGILLVYGQGYIL